MERTELQSSTINENTPDSEQPDVNGEFKRILADYLEYTKAVAARHNFQPADVEDIAGKVMLRLISWADKYPDKAIELINDSAETRNRIKNLVYITTERTIIDLHKSRKRDPIYRRNDIHEAGIAGNGSPELEKHPDPVDNLIIDINTENRIANRLEVQKNPKLASNEWSTLLSIDNDSLRQLIPTLDDRSKRVIEMDIQGYSSYEIAKILGYPESGKNADNWVEAIRSRAKKKMRKTAADLGLKY